MPYGNVRWNVQWNSVFRFRFDECCDLLIFFFSLKKKEKKKKKKNLLSTGLGACSVAAFRAATDLFDWARGGGMKPGLLKPHSLGSFVKAFVKA